MSTGFIVFGHGSSIESANEAVRSAARDLARRIPGETVEAAFLDGGRPDLDQAVADVAARGVRRVVVIPYFLTLGLHLQRDLPRIVERLRGVHQGVEIEVTEPLDGHPGLIEALADRAQSVT